MIMTVAIAFGAGLAAALLFIVWMKGTLIAMALAYLSPLPLMIATLGWGPIPGLAALLVGALATGAAINPVVGAVFAGMIGLPALVLGVAARVDPFAFGMSPTRRRPGTSPAGLVLWATGLSTALVLGAVVAVIVRRHGYVHAVTALESELAPRLGPVFETAGRALDGMSTADLAAILVRLVPVAAAGGMVLVMLVNLYLAARTLQVSQRLVWPFPSVPDGMRLPRAVAALFGLLLAGVFVGGAFGLGCAIVASALGTAFTLQGLATVHVMTRGLALRGLVLAFCYGLLLVVPWPLSPLGFALLGLADCLLSLRDRLRAPSRRNP